MTGRVGVLQLRACGHAGKKNALGRFVQDEKEKWAIDPQGHRAGSPAHSDRRRGAPLGLFLVELEKSLVNDCGHGQAFFPPRHA